MTFLNLYKRNSVFFSAFIVFLAISLFILLFYSKANGFFLLNPFHVQWLDIFFTYFTYAGDGFFCVGVGLLLFILKKRFLSLMVLSSYAVSGITAQILKYYILEARPAVLLQNTSYKYFIENVTLHNLHAFPSGHTASAFAMAAVLSFYVSNKKYSLLFLLYSISVGYSRIYLAQHFLDDVFIGAIIGVFSSVICWIFLENVFKKLLLNSKF